MSNIEDIKAALAAAKAEVKAEAKEPEKSIIITDKAEIEAALADTVEELPKDELSRVHARICAILLEHRNEITSIPQSHEYWKLMNRYNGLRNP